ncbi:hypothetical protein CU014_2629 [Enterococcus xinjiangensis]|nr:hypothetical protein [Enterococcus faecium]MBL4998780.1 hypothetical protein [Enterococcus lactis]
MIKTNGILLPNKTVFVCISQDFRSIDKQLIINQISFTKVGS